MKNRVKGISEGELVAIVPGGTGGSNPIRSTWVLNQQTGLPCPLPPPTMRNPEFFNMQSWGYDFVLVRIVNVNIRINFYISFVLITDNIIAFYDIT